MLVLTGLILLTLFLLVVKIGDVLGVKIVVVLVGKFCVVFVCIVGIRFNLVLTSFLSTSGKYT